STRVTTSSRVTSRPTSTYIPRSRRPSRESWQRYEQATQSVFGPAACAVLAAFGVDRRTPPARSRGIEQVHDRSGADGRDRRQLLRTAHRPQAAGDGLQLLR